MSWAYAVTLVSGKGTIVISDDACGCTAFAAQGLSFRYYRFVRLRVRLVPQSAEYIGFTYVGTGLSTAPDYQAVEGQYAAFGVGSYVTIYTDVNVGRSGLAGNHPWYITSSASGDEGQDTQGRVFVASNTASSTNTIMFWMTATLEFAMPIDTAIAPALDPMARAELLDALRRARRAAEPKPLPLPLGKSSITDRRDCFSQDKSELK